MVWQITAAFFALASPFLVFLEHNQYPVLRVETTLCWLVIGVFACAAGLVSRVSRHAGNLALAACLTLFIDVHFRIFTHGYALAATFIFFWAAMTPFSAQAARVLTAAGAVVFASTLLLPDSAGGTRTSTRTAAASASRLPAIVHIVLDGHIGIEGLQEAPGGAALGKELQTFYRRHGFMLFGGAYSEHFDTFRSLGHELNFAPLRHTDALYATDGDRFSWRLTRNAYFDALARAGYRITAHQTTFLDVCPGGGAEADCKTYDYAGIAELQTVPATSVEKAFAILRIYLSRARVYHETAFQYEKLRWHLGRRGVPLPVWRESAKVASPLVALKAIDRVINDVADTARGEYLFAHILAPHEPYLLDRRCTPAAPGQWLTRGAAEISYAARNTSQSREVRYRRYFDQTRCVYSRLDRLLGALPPGVARDAIVIIQGDHGSRITIVDPGAEAHGDASSQDYIDSFSTLFAIRAPQLGAGYDDRMVPITCLLKALVESNYSDTSSITACAADPKVFVDGAGGVEAHPLEFD